MSKWHDNEIQFARLICEIVAAVPDLHAADLCASMDLTPEELQELFDRADRVWERSKAPNPNYDPDSSVSTECDECGASIPDDERSMVNASHEESCSLYGEDA